MKRTSIIGPVILITLGALLLWVNLSGGAEVLQLLSVYWPWILVAWGAIRLGELFFWSQQGAPLPARGLSGGEWFLAVLICVAGSSLYGSRMVLGDLGNLSLSGPGLRMFGESYDFTVPDQAVPTGKSARLLVENLRGEVMVTADDVEDVRVSGRESLRAMSEDDAKDAWESRRVTVEQQGDLVVVRTNQEGMSSDRRARAYLQIRVPRNCSLETRGRNLNVEVSGLQGAVDVQSDEGQAVVTNVKGNVTVRVPRSNEVRVRGVEGTVEVSSSRGDNLSLREVRGPVTVKGAFSGNIELRQIAGVLRVEDRRLDLRAAAVPGEVTATRGKFSGRGLTGPVRLSGESKDIALEEFTDSLELRLMRSDAAIRQVGPKVVPMDIEVQRGKVTLALPSNAAYRLDGQVRRGEVANRSGRVFTEDSSGDETRISGGAANAPLVRVKTGRLELESSTSTP